MPPFDISKFRDLVIMLLLPILECVNKEEAPVPKMLIQLRWHSNRCSSKSIGTFLLLSSQQINILYYT